MRKTLIICAILLSQSPALAEVATWYNLTGRKMANGQRFNPNAMTAAHYSHRLGSVHRICHKGRCIRVKVTDRKPSPGWDLTPTAFRKLANLKKGVIRVKR